jgi:hypothetical protein
MYAANVLAEPAMTRATLINVHSQTAPAPKHVATVLAQTVGPTTTLVTVLEQPAQAS